MMGSTNAVLYNVLSVLDLAGHGQLLDVSVTARPEHQPSKWFSSSHDISIGNVSQGGRSGETVRDLSDRILGLPSAMRSRKKVRFHMIHFYGFVFNHLVISSFY